MVWPFNTDWGLVGRIAGWEEVCDLHKCCGQVPTVVMADPSSYGICQCQVECKVCGLRGEIGATLGHAIRLWVKCKQEAGL